MTNAKRPVFQAPAKALKPFTPIDPSRSLSRAYLRFLVKDEPGVIAAVSETLAEAGVSIESFLQMPVHSGPAVPIVLTTQTCSRAKIEAAVRAIEALDVVAEAPLLMPVEQTGQSWGRS